MKERRHVLNCLLLCSFNWLVEAVCSVKASCINNEGAYPCSIPQVRWVLRHGFQTHSPLSLGVVTWHSPFSFPDLPCHSNQICDTNWVIMTMTTRVKCCVHQTLTGPPTFPPSPSSLFSAHYVVAPNLLNTFLNDSYCVSLQRNLELRIFLA